VENKSACQWRDIAAELSYEFNPKRFIELSTELAEAIDRELRVPKNKKEEHPRVPPNRQRHSTGSAL
jgi:hypothetical protein